MHFSQTMVWRFLLFFPAAIVAVSSSAALSASRMDLHPLVARSDQEESVESTEPFCDYSLYAQRTPDGVQDTIGFVVGVPWAPWALMCNEGVSNQMLDCFRQQDGVRDARPLEPSAVSVEEEDSFCEWRFFVEILRDDHAEPAVDPSCILDTLFCLGENLPRPTFCKPRAVLVRFSCLHSPILGLDC